MEHCNYRFTMDVCSFITIHLLLSIDKLCMPDLYSDIMRLCKYENYFIEIYFQLDHHALKKTFED